MARFYMKLKDDNIILIEVSKDVIDDIKPNLVDKFGIPFLRSEQEQGDLFIYEFEASEEDYIQAKNGLNLSTLKR